MRIWINTRINEF